MMALDPMRTACKRYGALIAYKYDFHGQAFDGAGYFSGQGQMPTSHAFTLAVQQHDERVAALGFAIWVGSEPTFTDRQALTPAWLYAALGEDKEQRAQTLLCSLSQRMPNGLLLRSLGRRYPGEKAPRWNFGLLRRRDGQPLWRGPPDPMQTAPAEPLAPAALAEFANTLATAFADQAWATKCHETPNGQGELAWTVNTDLGDDTAQLLGFVLHIEAFEREADPVPCAILDLPTITRVDHFLAVLACIERAALGCDLPALVLAGANPPVDATIELTTITPDPAVIEINTAPSTNCAEFFWRSQQVYGAAEAQHLSPYRLYFNGQVADSGGAGQVTFGGPTPQDSPFIQHPQLLPGLVRFLNRHPALSYLFAHDFVGGGGQSVRPDERGADAFDDLVLALALLERESDPSPELLWKSLASFLCDTVGNSHRAEINIEKLWNPYLPGRGQLGLVEFRSLRMQHTPQRATAIACLFRALIAMLAVRPYRLPLIDWGRKLHDRFALPFYLQADLDAVFAELADAELGLAPPLQDVLRQNEFRFFGKVELPFGSLELWRGLEFWPLVGDAASPEQTGNSRQVDASTTRIEVRWRPPIAAGSDMNELGSWMNWQLVVDGVCLPLRQEQDKQGALKLFGIRYASFVPNSGLHPTLAAQTPLTFVLCHADQTTSYTITLHEWQPDGQAYPGLPADLNEARERRAARITVLAEDRQVPLPDHDSTSQTRPTSLGLTGYSLDRRYR